MASSLDIAVETGARKVFASALDWPGWSRGARDEERAIQELLAYTDRFGVVAKRAALAFKPPFAVNVAERLPGGSGTDFGMPAVAAAADHERVTPATAKRFAALLTASWGGFDDVVRSAPASLRKGPRGGGRDRDAVAEHVRNAEVMYARKLGIDRDAPDLRKALLEMLGNPHPGGPVVENGWPLRYAARRITWHVLDHLWEIEDRSD
jgi:hypothetical protein